MRMVMARRKNSGVSQESWFDIEERVETQDEEGFM
jgi:hypothetical protein